jgi:UV DNA damage endonuclease
MRLGYACINIGNESTKISSVTLKNATEERLREIIKGNLESFKNILEFNIKNDIKFFRISSEMIPFASHPVNKVDWEKEFEEEFSFLGSLIRDNDIRVSMHPGQYNVLNSRNENVVKRTIEDLTYHHNLLTALGCDAKGKLTLHIGGVYGNKELAKEMFAKNFKLLDEGIRNRIIIENDDHNYTVEDVLDISREISVPVVFDILHHKNNPSIRQMDINSWLALCKATWKKSDGKQKVHYSQAQENGTKRAHSYYIKAREFLDFYNDILDKDIDIMLEVKNKNLSAIKCNLLLKEDLHIKELEKEWARYKYYVLSKSANIYNEIRVMLKDKEHPDALKFYELIEIARKLPDDLGAQINAIQHIWGYFKSKATESERKRYKKLKSELRKSKNYTPIKNHLLKCARVHDIKYLKESYYFYI